MDPLLFDFPDSVATRRLDLRCPRPGDGRAMHAAKVESIEELRRFPASLPWAMEVPSVASDESYCRLAYSNFIARRDLPYLIWHRAFGVVAGATGLHRMDWTVPRFEVGFWVRTSFKSQGIATEAVRALVQFALQSLDARRVEAFPDDLNIASCRVCERAGLRLEGVLTNERGGFGGGPRNTRVYAVTR
jgi:RimJ/RimL family protein N-acetyltransferase